MGLVIPELETFVIPLTNGDKRKRSKDEVAVDGTVPKLLRIITLVQLLRHVL